MIDLKEGFKKLEYVMRAPRVDDDPRFSYSHTMMLIDKSIVNDLIGIDLYLCYGVGRYCDGTFLAFSRDVLDYDEFDSLLNNEYFFQLHDSSMISSMICYSEPYRSHFASRDTIEHLAHRFNDSIHSAQIFPSEIGDLINNSRRGEYSKNYKNIENSINAEKERENIDRHIGDNIKIHNPFAKKSKTKSL